MNGIAEQLAVARWCLDLGLVERGTRHQDGTTPETDTTHTVMLALIALQLAQQIDGVNIANVLAYALVHDLLEARAGDVNTARGLTKEQRAQKAAREAEALKHLRSDSPSLAALVERYEAQADFESRFVRVLDKAMPKLTHALNGHRPTIEELGIDAIELLRLHRKQGVMLRRQCPEQTVAHRFFDDACWVSEGAYGKAVLVCGNRDWRPTGRIRLSGADMIVIDDPAFPDERPNPVGGSDE